MTTDNNYVFTVQDHLHISLTEIAEKRRIAEMNLVFVFSILLSL